MHVRTASAIGAAIRSRRRELKLDQAQLARKIGATRQWLIAIEKGKDTAEIARRLRELRVNRSAWSQPGDVGLRGGGSHQIAAGYRELMSLAKSGEVTAFIKNDARTSY